MNKCKHTALCCVLRKYLNRPVSLDPNPITPPSAPPLADSWNVVSRFQVLSLAGTPPPTSGGAVTFHERGLDDPSFSSCLPTGKAHPIHRCFLVGCNSAASSDGSGFSLTLYSATLSPSPVRIPIALAPLLWAKSSIVGQAQQTTVCSWSRRDDSDPVQPSQVKSSITFTITISTKSTNSTT